MKVIKTLENAGFTEDSHTKCYSSPPVFSRFRHQSRPSCRHKICQKLYCSVTSFCYYSSMSVFVIEDESHAEWCGKFASYEEALRELKVRAKLPWDMEPNKCTCTSWETCGRNYIIIEFENSKGESWEELSRSLILSVSSQGTVWHTNQP